MFKKKLLSIGLLFLITITTTGLATTFSFVPPKRANGQILTSLNATIYTALEIEYEADTSCTKIQCAYSGNTKYEWTADLDSSSTYIFIETTGTDSIISGMDGIPIFTGTVVTTNINDGIIKLAHLEAATLDSSALASATIPFSKLKTDNEPTTDQVYAYSGDGDGYWKDDATGALSDSTDLPAASVPFSKLKTDNEPTIEYVYAYDGNGDGYWKKIVLADSTGLPAASVPFSKLKTDNEPAIDQVYAYSGDGDGYWKDDATGAVNWTTAIASIRTTPFWYSDATALSTGAANAFIPWLIGASFGTGAGTTTVGVAQTTSHPGTVKMNSGTGANSGYVFSTDPTSFLISGGENTETTFYYTTPGDDSAPYSTILKFGWHDAVTTDFSVTDGVFIQCDSSVVCGKTISNTSNTKTTATAGTLSAATWYRAKVSLNSDATIATFYIYNDAGSTVWSDTLQTASCIPTGAGRFVGNRFLAAYSGTTAKVLVEIDWIATWFTRTLTR